MLSCQYIHRNNCSGSAEFKSMAAVPPPLTSYDLLVADIQHEMKACLQALRLLRTPPPNAARTSMAAQRSSSLVACPCSTPGSKPVHHRTCHVMDGLRHLYLEPSQDASSQRHSRPCWIGTSTSDLIKSAAGCQFSAI